MKKSLFIVLTVVMLALSLVMLSSCMFLATWTPPSVKREYRDMYSKDESYEVIHACIKRIKLPDSKSNNTIAGFTLEQNEKETLTNSYQIPYESVQVLIANGFELVASEKVYAFRVSLEYWHDAFAYPIVAVEECDGEKIYLDLQTGKSNWLQYFENAY